MSPISACRLDLTAAAALTRQNTARSTTRNTTRITTRNTTRNTQKHNTGLPAPWHNIAPLKYPHGVALCIDSIVVASGKGFDSSAYYSANAGEGSHQHLQARRRWNQQERSSSNSREKERDTEPYENHDLPTIIGSTAM
jgi:hypothetical protein